MAGKHPKRKDRPGVDRYGRTELHNAIIDGDADMARALVAAGARVDEPIEILGQQHADCLRDGADNPRLQGIDLVADRESIVLEDRISVEYQ